MGKIYLKKAGVGVVAILGLLLGFIPSTSWADIPTPDSDHFVVTFPTYGDRAADGSLAGTAGAVLQLTDNTGVPYTQDWATCTTDAQGNCSFTIPVDARGSLSSSVGVSVVSSSGWIDPHSTTTSPSVRLTSNPAGQKLTTTAPYVLERANPQLPDDCGANGLKVAFLADLSGSMGYSGNLGINSLKTALDSFVDTLTGTNSQIALFTFSTGSPAVNGTNHPLTSVRDQTGADEVTGVINSWGSGGSTYWGAGLQTIATSTDTYDMVIVITDGESPNDMNDFIGSANAIKAKGTRIIVIGAGADLAAGAAALPMVSGPVHDSVTIAADDYFMSGWSDVNTLLTDLATNVCPAVSNQFVDISYIDDDANEAVVGTLPSMSGLSGDPIGFTEAAARAGVPAGYSFVGLDSANPANYDDDYDALQHILIHVNHALTTTSLTVTRTIHYVGAGALTPADVVQNQEWTVTTDQVTHTTVYTTAQGYADVKTPVLTGFSADVATVPSVDIPAPTSVKPVDTEVIVTYTPLPKAPEVQTGGSARH